MSKDAVHKIQGGKQWKTKATKLTKQQMEIA